MNSTTLELLPILLGSLELIVLIVLSIRSLPMRRSMAPVFFTFALVSYLFSNVYWIAYDLLRPDTRMPFAANEFGEIGLFLLLTSTLSAVFRGRFAAARQEMLCAAVFATASVALWIGWSGEWLQDILVGFCFGYCLCDCVRSLKQSDALSKTEWRLLGGLAAMLMLLQGATFFLSGPWKAAADYGAYSIMFSVLLYALGKTIRAMRCGQEPIRQVALSVSCFVWTESTLYMSADVFYVAAEVSLLVCLPLMLIALRREEAAA
jgi:hypothetical protein